MIIEFSLNKIFIHDLKIVYLNVSNTTSALWSLSGNQKNSWKNAQISIYSAKAFRVSFEAIRGQSSTSDIAIDDIEFLEKPCSLKPTEADPIFITTTTTTTTTRSLRPTSTYDCTFEIDLCKWALSPESTFNWTRTQGIAGSEVQGLIDYDHTLGSSNGWYVSTNVNNKQITDKARIETSVSITGSQCMEFYYYFSTNSKYQFNIYVKLGNQLGFPIWSRSESQGEFWRLGRVTVNSGSSYQVMLELTGLVNGARTDKFGLDDIYFTSGACQDSSDINKLCTFSGTTCGYQINNTANFKWQLFVPTNRYSELEMEQQSKLNPLPINDHTTNGVGSGYMFAESKNFKLNDVATLTSQTYPPFSVNITDSSRCLEFYFYLQGNDAIKLNVKTSTTLNKNTIWSRDYDHSSYWWKGEATIKLLTNYSLIFEAVALNNPINGLVGLDDVILRNGQCSRFFF
jgi:hypothetical protein